MTNPTFDNSIPELTEVIIADAVSEAVANVTSPTAATSFSSRTTSTFTTPPLTNKVNEVSNQAHALANWTDEEWRRLETEIRERIALQLLGRIDFVLEQRVRDSLADVLQTAVEGLANEIKQGLHTTLKDVIARAVNQEITRLKSTKN